jgi:regulator of protease activity HflC (stomatin/prohibitin superfamily)
VDRPALPPPEPGRSALPSLLSLEAHVRGLRARADADAAARVAQAEGEASRVRAEGEARLREVLLAAEQEAVRHLEAEARDRVSGARVRVQRWVEDAEAASGALLEETLDLIAGTRPSLPEP